MALPGAVKKKPKQNPKETTTTTKSITGEGEKACLLISTLNFGKYLFFLPFFFEIAFLS